MEKYSNIYVDQKYARARFSPDFPKANSLVAYRPHAEFLYDQLHEKCPQLESRPIIFHMFSQTGVRIFVALWDLMDAKNGRLKNSQIRGLIFDSCPANVQPHHVAKTLAQVNYPLDKYSRLLHYTVFVAATAVLQIHRFGILLEALRDPKARSRHFAFERLKELDNLPNKHLYLYAENDDLCLAKETRQFAKKQKDSGVEVTERCWSDSGHCRHFVCYPDEYKSKSNVAAIQTALGDKPLTAESLLKAIEKACVSISKDVERCKKIAPEVFQDIYPQIQRDGNKLILEHICAEWCKH
ncbi:Transmembrane protein 53 [Aphelenchoides besseyi]|nr:Transmembrane protein 53 [Aphelenchoides besseyi]